MTAFSLSWWNNSARFLLRGMNMIWDSVEILHFSCIHMELTETRIHSIRDRNDFHKILITPHDLIAIFVIGWTMVPDVCSCNLINCHLNDLSLRFLIWFDVGLTLGESVMELKNALAIRWISSVSKLEEMKTVGCPPSPPPSWARPEERKKHDLTAALGKWYFVGCTWWWEIGGMLSFQQRPIGSLCYVTLRFSAWFWLFVWSDLRTRFCQEVPRHR